MDASPTQGQTIRLLLDINRTPDGRLEGQIGADGTGNWKPFSGVLELLPLAGPRPRSAPQPGSRRLTGTEGTTVNLNDTTSTARIGNASYLDRPGGRIGKPKSTRSLEEAFIALTGVQS
jgi:hypothetical protein